MINTIIIFGSNGMLGRYITKYFREKTDITVIALTRTEFEITHKSILSLDTFMKNFKINENTCVINCNGLIPQRSNGRNANDYYLINTLFPLYLSKVCLNYNTKLICPTTDCVFSGNKGNYIETDFHDEVNDYGISKSLGEPHDATVIRTSIIGEELENKKSFLEFIKNSTGEINGWDNHYWNGITCYQYCKIIHTIITNNLFWKGVRHIYSPNKKTKYELACIIKNVYNIDVNINKYISSFFCDKTLLSNYETNTLFNIPELENQILDQARFRI
jgi:dTDP-4-dehydrorhamnose reductase